MKTSFVSILAIFIASWPAQVLSQSARYHYEGQVVVERSESRNFCSSWQGAVFESSFHPQVGGTVAEDTLSLNGTGTALIYSGALPGTGSINYRQAIAIGIFGGDSGPLVGQRRDMAFTPPDVSIKPDRLVLRGWLTVKFVGGGTCLVLIRGSYLLNAPASAQPPNGSGLQPPSLSIAQE